MAVRVRVLGVPVVERGGDEVPVVGERLGSLLALLALRADTPVPAAVLAEAVWGEVQPANAANALQALVSRLRRLVGSGALVGEAGTYRLRLDPLTVDAASFAAGVERGAAANRVGDHDRASRLLAAALGHWRGPLLAGAGINGPLAVEAVRLDELHEVAWEERLEAELGRGQHEPAVAAAERLVAAQPLRERRWGQLMVALYRSGRQADALRTFQRLRSLLVERLGIDPSRSLVDLERAILTQDPTLDWRPSAVPVRRPTNVRPLDVVGREDELKAVQSAVESHRCTLVIGPGGVGKTALVRAASLSLPDEVCPDGVWFADVTASRLLADARASVAAAVPGSDGDSTDVRLSRLAAADALVIIDGCEHLGPSAAELAAELLALGPRVRVLLTSRLRLRLPADPVDADDVEVIAVGGLDPTAAAALFRRRAAAAGIDHLGATDDDLIALVHALDRLPLAIELAAARAPYLSVTEIASRLDDRLHLLRRTSSPGRHESLAAVLDASHDLLSDTTKTIYRRLAVLPGSFAVDAAEAVVGTDVAGRTVIDALVELVDHSLLDVGRSPAGPRYRFLDTVASHAAARLGEAGERAECEQRLVAWAVDVCRRAEAALDTPDEPAHLAVLDREADLISGALALADPAARAAMALGLWPWWDLRGRVGQGIDALRRVLGDAATNGPLDDDDPDRSSPDRNSPDRSSPDRNSPDRNSPDRNSMVWLRFALGQLLERDGDLDGARAELEAAVAAGRELGDARLIARGLATVAYIDISAGRNEAARATAEEAATAAARSGDLVASLAAGNAAAYLAYATGRRSEAVARWEAAAEAARHGGLVRRRPLILANLGVALGAAADPARSLAVLEEALDAAVDAGDVQQAALAKANIVAAHRALDRPVDARRVATEAQETLLLLGDERSATKPLAHLAELALEADDRAAAHAAAIRLTEIARRRGLAVEETLGLRLQGMVAAAYGRQHQAVAFYRGALERLPPDGYNDARGRNLELLGKSLIALGETERALEALVGAREMFATLENEPIDELDDLIAGVQAELRASTTCS